MKSTLVEKAGASDASGIASACLQQILGTDKRNPIFSLFEDPVHQSVHLYYGAELFEVVPKNKGHLAFKCLLGRLYNAGLKAKSLQQVFKVDRKTMQRWGQALQADDPELLLRALAGRGAHRKLTVEIRSFVALRFAVLYAQSRRGYSQAIRGEIKQVFGVSLSGEALRPLFRQLKAELRKETTPPPPPTAAPEKRETACELPPALPGAGSTPASTALSPSAETSPALAPTRKQSPVLPASKSVRLCHHLGVLVFSPWLGRLEQHFTPQGQFWKQWSASLLLGALNIEQSKLLDFEDLNRLFGPTTRSLPSQRSELSRVAAIAHTVPSLLAFNAQVVDPQKKGRDFYFDPHTKHYTGLQKILKGWCARIRFADKVAHTDFIHTAEGFPVYLGWSDNYQDLRERFFKVAENFRAQTGLAKEALLTLIIDRGIFSHPVFGRIIEAPNYHLITWEKNYQRDQWDPAKKSGAFVLERVRNHARDKRSYHFEYMDRPWPSQAKMRQLIVRATNPRGKRLEVSVLTDDLERPAPQSITLIFNRWIQENDFKYLDKHFGINEITSYASVSYEELRGQLEDKQVQSGADKALQQQQRQLKQQLGRLLLSEHRHPKKSARRTAQIKQSTEELKALESQRAAVQKEVSRLAALIEQHMVRLDTRNKSVMDCLKLMARNAFYLALQPFKAAYNNFRDDHELFRNLTQCDGVLVEDADQVEAHLLPTVNYPPKMRKLIEQLLEQINAADPKMPDGSQRRLRLHLAEKEGIQLAMTLN